ncbi:MULTISPECIES: PPE domain-containing protein [Mycobacterium]|uniref:Uncharacterized protein n=1 Tax=Mycobacterium pseudokansasii TaxID=2341080 RepID=A0A498R3P5_9MYCO|nr:MULTISPECIES: PPE domain-containing protein [Mycobacterium]VBA68831.1 hypothetical protein LAUMK142_05866 [Mycobacterium pseudokansasii]
MDLWVDPDGLRADAGALDASGHPNAPASVCQAAAGDSVSAHLSGALSAWSHSLHLLHEHAGQQRAIGGMAIAGTAADLAGTDDENAAAIGGIMDGSAPMAGGAPAGPSAGNLPALPAPSLPTIPTMTTPPPMSAEQVAAQVHSGPGPQSLRTFATNIRKTLAPSVLRAAHEARRTGTSVAENWVDGQQRAATNIARHADWLESSLHPQILALARAADDVATHTETLIRSTPRPEEFTDLRQRLQVALANYNTSGGANAAQVEALSTELSKKRAAAMSAMQGFSTAAPPTISGAAKPPQPAPPIVHNPDEPAQTLNPHGHPESGGDHDGTTEGRGHHSGGDYNADDLGSPDHPPAGAAAAPGNPTQVAPLAGADPNSASMLAQVAGMIMGTGTGAVGQVTHGLGGASPLSALSSLSSLPGMGGGMPHMGTPEMPMPDTGGSGSPSDGAGSDFGSGGTSPAGGAGDSGGGGGAAMSSSSPAVGPSVGSGLTVGSPTAGGPTGGGPSGGGLGMMPPMIGGMGGKQDEGRKSEERRRVVERPMPNTEPVFGEVRRETRRRRAPDKKT